MLHNFIAGIVLATSLLALAPSAFSNLAPESVRLRTLLKQQPWDKQRLQSIVALDLAHDHLRAKKPRHWKEKTRLLAADPDYIPNVEQVVSDIIQSLPFEEQKIEKLMLWKMTDPQGKQHWLFSTMHHITLANFAEETRLQLENIIDTATAILHENVPLDSIELAHVMLDIEGYDEIIDKLVQLDVQIIARGIHRDKKIMALETPADRLAIPRNRTKISRLLARLSSFMKKKLSAEQRAANTVAIFEDLFAIQNAYLSADLSVITSAMNRDGGIDNEELADTNDRNHLWLDRIVTQCEQNANCLIIAGLAHMTHDSKKTKSIITLLRERGFTIEFIE